MTWVRRALSAVWRSFMPRARIGVRIITAVVLAMTLVLLAAGAFVYWRISYALDRQLDQDLLAYSKVVRTTMDDREPLPADSPGLVAQTYTLDGSLKAKSDPGVRDLLTLTQARGASTSPRTIDVGRFIPPPPTNPYRIRYQVVATPTGKLVLAVAISKHKHDEALRELLLQLGAADLAAILAAGVVGWGATRAALGPVERYRRAAAGAGGNPSARLPIDATRNDELTRLGTTFNTLLGQIEAGHRRERQFLADASHELRSPLALLAAEVEWARHRPRSSEEVDEVLISVAAQTQRLADLADALLRLEEASESNPATAEEANLASLVVNAAQPHLGAAESLGRRIHINAEEMVVRVEARWLEIAISNLTANALRHGQGAITIHAEVQTEPVRRIHITVADEGPGIPDHLGESAFERFARAEESRTTPGNGLGLAIVAAVAHRHHGTVTLVPGGVRMDLAEWGL